MLRVTLAAAPAEQGGHFTLGVFYGNARIFLTPPPCMPFVARKMATLRNVLMLARRSCHWGPIIALSLVTIVTSSSTYCLFQLSVLPNVVVFLVCSQHRLLLMDRPHSKELLSGLCLLFCGFCVYFFYIIRASCIIGILRVVLKTFCVRSGRVSGCMWKSCGGLWSCC